MPEEINRVLTDHVSTLLFCPTDAAVSNLANEGIINGVHRVGDVMYDALLHNLELSRKNSAILQRLGLTKKEFALATVHRAANTDDRSRMQALLSAFGSLDVHVVFPVHPRTQKMMREWGIPAESNVKLIEPVGYFDMLALLENANCVLTDSGGVQKEAYLVGTRCITLREETEWVETVEAGWNKLAGTNPDTIRSLFVSWFPTGERVLLYGNGNAADEIAAVIQQVLG
jgi:UDP-N-acetylglucosamine 2-epimerase